MADEARQLRAAQRRHRMTIRYGSLDEPNLSVVRGPAALALVADLTRECWALAGFAIPTYSRTEIRVRFVPR